MLFRSESALPQARGCCWSCWAGDLSELGGNSASDEHLCRGGRGEPAGSKSAPRVDGQAQERGGCAPSRGGGGQWWSPQHTRGTLHRDPGWPASSPRFAAGNWFTSWSWSHGVEVESQNLEPCIPAALCHSRPPAPCQGWRRFRLTESCGRCRRRQRAGGLQ